MVYPAFSPDIMGVLSDGHYMLLAFAVISKWLAVPKS